MIEQLDRNIVNQDGYPSDETLMIEGMTYLISAEEYKGSESQSVVSGLEIYPLDLQAETQSKRAE